MATSPATALCCFCFKAVDVSQRGDGIAILVTKDGSPASQELFAHSACLGEHLHPRVPFDPDAWEEATER
jgi:hypothetical protein